MRCPPLLLSLLALGAAAPVFGHGHPAALAPDDPLAADVRFCNRVVDAALQALQDRERGRAPAVFPGDDRLSRLQAEVTQHVFAEPQIRSQKFAMGYARSRCNEALGAAREAGSGS